MREGELFGLHFHSDGMSMLENFLFFKFTLNAVKY